jgi:HAD superfamily hydrolase (TIGR01509 family)
VRHHAVIFDCDGVLIDSERVACRIDSRELTAHGFPITAAALISRFSGVAYRDMYRMLEAETGARLPEGYAERTHALVLAASEAEGMALAMPGVHAMLDALDGRATCVASSSAPDWLQRTLGQTGLWQRFAPRVYSAVQVSRGKPAPDLFLLAAARLGAAPADCRVVEDSVAGVQAGKAAGMPVIGFCGGGHCDAMHAARLRAAGADSVVATMAELAVALDDDQHI